MIKPEPNKIITPREYSEIQRDQEKQLKVGIKVVKLPCGHGSTQIPLTHTIKKISCTICFKHWTFYWQEYERARIYENKR